MSQLSSESLSLFSLNVPVNFWLIFSRRKSALSAESPFLAVTLDFLSLSLALIIMSVVIASCEDDVVDVASAGRGFSSLADCGCCFCWITGPGGGGGGGGGGAGAKDATVGVAFFSTINCAVIGSILGGGGMGGGCSCCLLTTSDAISNVLMDGSNGSLLTSFFVTFFFVPVR